MDKARLRKLHKMIPVMVKASLMNQAIHLGRVVASTFEPSDSMKKLMGGVPPAYREKILAVYGDVMLKAFQGGTTCSGDLAGTCDLAEEDLWKHLKANFGMPKESQDALIQEFRDCIKKYMPAVSDEPKVMMQMQTDLNKAYLEGIADCCRDLKTHQLATPQSAESAPAQPKPMSVGLPEVPADALTVAPGMPGPNPGTSIGVPPLGAPALSAKDDKKDEKLKKGGEKEGPPTRPMAAKPKPPVSEKPAPGAAPGKAEIYKQLEFYTKLLNDPVAEQVLRYTLGLPVTGSTQVTADEGFEDGGEPHIDGPDQMPESPMGGDLPEMPPKMSSGDMSKVGPYDVEELKLKLSDVLKHHNLADTNLQVVPVDCLVSGISQLSGTDLAGHIARQLGQHDDMVSYLGSCTLEDSKEVADMVADDLTASMMFPGEFLFLEVDDDYCLCFCYERERAGDIGALTQSITTAAAKKQPKKSAVADGLPESPGGALSATDLKEVKTLSQFTSIRSVGEFKELTKIAPKMAKFLGQKLTDTRNSKQQLADLCAFLSQKMIVSIGDVYGSDAQKAIAK